MEDTKNCRSENCWKQPVSARAHHWCMMYQRGFLSLRWHFWVASEIGKRWSWIIGLAGEHNFLEWFQKEHTMENLVFRKLAFKARQVVLHTWSPWLPKFSMSAMVFKHIFVNHRAVFELGRESGEIVEDSEHEDTGSHHTSNLIEQYYTYYLYWWQITTNMNKYHRTFEKYQQIWFATHPPCTTQGLCKGLCKEFFR